MRKLMTLAVGALLSGCAPSHEQSMLNRGCRVGEPDAHCDQRIHEETQARWRANNCQTGENDQQCEARLGRETQQAIAARRAQEADPIYQAEQTRRTNLELAADAQCKFTAQQAYMQVDIARPSLLGLEAVGYRNMTYRSCMQAHGYAIPGGSGGPAPTLSDVFN